MKKWTKRYDFGTQLGKIVRRINCKIRRQKKGANGWINDG